MKYKLTFSWRDDIITTRQVILEADSKEHAERLLMYSVEPIGHDGVFNKPQKNYLNPEIEDSNGSEDGSVGINGGYRDEIGVEIRKEYVNDEDDLNIQVEESK